MSRVSKSRRNYRSSNHDPHYSNHHVLDPLHSNQSFDNQYSHHNPQNLPTYLDVSQHHDYPINTLYYQEDGLDPRWSQSLNYPTDIRDPRGSQAQHQHTYVTDPPSLQHAEYRAWSQLTLAERIFGCDSTIANFCSGVGTVLSTVGTVISTVLSVPIAAYDAVCSIGTAISLELGYWRGDRYKSTDWKHWEERLVRTNRRGHVVNARDGLPVCNKEEFTKKGERRGGTQPEQIPLDILERRTWDDVWREMERKQNNELKHIRKPDSESFPVLQPEEPRSRRVVQFT